MACHPLLDAQFQFSFVLLGPEKFEYFVFDDGARLTPSVRLGQASIEMTYPGGLVYLKQ